VELLDDHLVTVPSHYLILGVLWCQSSGYASFEQQSQCS
jgi:hypothetical protein